MVGNTAWSRAYADHVTRLQCMTTNHTGMLKRKRVNPCRSEQTDRVSGFSRLATWQKSSAASTSFSRLGLIISLGFPVSSSPKAIRPVELAPVANTMIYQALQETAGAGASPNEFSQRISPPAFCLPQRREGPPTSECRRDLPGQTAP